MREMQIETTLDRYFSPVRLTKISAWEHILLVRLGGEAPSDIAGENTKGQQPMEANLAKSIKTTYVFTFGLRRKWQPTPVFLPGESQGQRSLVGCCLWARTESDMTEST